jgi:hypothetical protein
MKLFLQRRGQVTQALAAGRPGALGEPERIHDKDR